MERGILMDKWDYIKCGIFYIFLGLGVIWIIHDWYVDATYCHYVNCHKKSMSGYDYCYEHRYSDFKYEMDEREREHEYNRRHKKSVSSSGANSSYNSNSSSSSKSSSSYSYSSSKKNSNTKKDIFHDPADYDTPEDYADDAWGVDFDDWDDAYDYWEDY